MLDDILKNMALYVDGRGYAGNVEELVLPKLTMKMEEYRNGGMDAPIDIEMGMEKLEAEFTLTRFDRNLLTLFGLAPGQIIPLTIRGAVVSDNGTVQPVIVNLQGQIKELDYGTWKPGEKTTLKCMVSVRFYKLTHGAAIVHQIDIPNIIRIVNGVDQLAQIRGILGQ